MGLLFRILPIVFALLMLGCGRGQDSDEQAPTVGFVLATLNNPFFIDMKTGAETAAKRLGLNVIIQAAERDVDVEKQVQIVENLIQRRVDVICITPIGSREIVAAIVKANRAEIPVLIVDSRVDEKTLRDAGGNIATFAGSDNFEGGRLAGEYIIRTLDGKGRVAILEGIPGHETGDSRLKGFHSAIDAQPGIEIVSSQNANWQRDRGYNVFQNILQSHPDVQAVFACNDLMALGAVEAIAAAGKTRDIIVVGFDAIEDARQAVRNGVMDATVAQYPEEMGRVAIENAHRLLKGETIPEFVPVKIELITRENVDRSPTRGR